MPFSMLAVIRSRRFLNRLRVPAEPIEAQRAERVLAAARLFLAAGALAAIWLDPTQPSRYVGLAYLLLLLYVVHSLVALLLLRIWEVTPRFQFIVHVADLLWPAGITLFTEGPNSPFFVFFLLVLLAAAYRWGFRETMATAGAAVLLLSLEAVILGSPLSPAEGNLPGQWPSWHLLEGHLELNRMIMRATYLLIMGFVLGYLAEAEKLRRLETSLAARIAGGIQAQSGLGRTLEAILNEILRIHGAEHALIACEEIPTRQLFLWEARRGDASPGVRLQFAPLELSQRETYLFSTPAHSWLAVRRGSPGSGAFPVVALDGQGRRLRNLSFPLPEALSAAHPFAGVMAVSFTCGEEWLGRLFLLDPSLSRDREEELRFLQLLIRQTVPSIYSVYLLGRLRYRAGAAERARVARELHDGIIQSLFALELQVDVLRRQAQNGAAPHPEDLERIQRSLRQEVVSLRELMEEMRAAGSESRPLLDFLADCVEKFQRDTGIAAYFVSDVEDVGLSPRVSREVTRIVQEALVNVRKHAGARNVVVRFGAENGKWKLVIDDDGKGFGFSGWLSQARLDAERRGPVIIKERVRSIGGQLAIESTPGRGARLEITLPATAYRGKTA